MPGPHTYFPVIRLLSYLLSYLVPVLGLGRESCVLVNITGRGPRANRLDFGGDPNTESDP